MALPAAMRLRGYRCFKRIHRYGSIIHGKWMVFKVIKADITMLLPKLRTKPTRCCRCALVISNKVNKSSVMRNRLRRIFHSHLRSRLECREDLGDQWLLVSLRPEANQIDHSHLLQECDLLLKTAWSCK